MVLGRELAAPMKNWHRWGENQNHPGRRTSAKRAKPGFVSGDVAWNPKSECYYDLAISKSLWNPLVISFPVIKDMLMTYTLL